DHRDDGLNNGLPSSSSTARCTGTASRRASAGDGYVWAPCLRTGASTLRLHAPGTSGTTCRAAAGGGCDVAETCTGSSSTCPNDAFQPSTFVCRAAANECDLQETCPGNSATCPGDSVKASGTACSDDGNVCTTDLCNGTVGSPLCVHNPGNAGTTCRAAAGGGCDVAETCTGTSSTCPNDAFQSSTFVCRAAANECDLQETCPGNSATCPGDTVKASGTACTDDGN